MRITVLTHVEAEGDREVDEVVPQVTRALEQLGHEVSVLAVHGDVRRCVGGLARRKPDLVFNLMEMWGDIVAGDVLATALLEIVGVPYTGGGPGELYLTQDKALSKKMLAYEGVLYPRFAVFSTEADFETGGNLRMPMFVKPLAADASIGIEGDSLVRDAVALLHRVERIHAEIGSAALAEEYIEGREFYVGVLGNQDALALPPIEVDFTGFPEGQPHVMGAKAKFDVDSPEYKGTRSVVADIPDELRAKLQHTALRAYRALRVRDYGRVDLRLTDEGDIYVLEVNANPYLEQASEFATAAAATGIGYPELLGRIVEAACARRHLQPPAAEKRAQRK